jgi:hypothetical protein
MVSKVKARIFLIRIQKSNNCEKPAPLERRFLLCKENQIEFLPKEVYVIINGGNKCKFYWIFRKSLKHLAVLNVQIYTLSKRWCRSAANEGKYI